jgi:hypothetical protein
MRRVKRPAQPVKNVPPCNLTNPKIQSIGLYGIACLLGRRTSRPEAVAALAESMKEMGLINPITIRPNETGAYTLITGRHRLEAARKLKWESIPAVIIEGLSADEAELREIDENLIRAELQMPRGPRIMPGVRNCTNRNTRKRSAGIPGVAVKRVAKMATLMSGILKKFPGTCLSYCFT